MSVQEFVDRYFSEAAAVSSKNLPPAFILAHAYLESGRGTSQLTVKGNNFFGIKAAPGQPHLVMLTREILNGKQVTIPQRFRKYATAKDSFKSYANLLSSNRYKKVLQANTNAARAQELKAAGYFTAGQNYVNALAKTAANFDTAIRNRKNSTIITPLILALILAGAIVYSNK